MDDFAEQKNPPVRIRAPGGVGEIDRAFDAVAEAEFLRQLDGEVARGKHVAAGANALDQLAAIVREHLGLDSFHDVRSAQVDFLGRGRRLG